MTSYNLKQDEFEAILESSYDGIHITNEKGITLYYNTACERIEGNKKDEVIGKDIRELVKSGIYEESLALKAVEKGEPITMVQNINGNDVMVTATPIILNGKITHVVANSRDITQLTILKKELDYTKQMNDRYHSELEIQRLAHKDLDIIAEDPSTKSVIDLAIHVANVDSVVLIQGESGAGKGVFSKLIHDHSQRKDQPFVKIDLSAIPDTLLESELFGYEQGAFTGANEKGKIGLIEFANGGTLFLDEIGEMPIALQTRLLRVLQDRKVVRIGDTKERPVDVRIIAATNKNLETMVTEQNFREDLYYRLNVVPIRIPSLRERKLDIFPLIMKVLEKFNKKYHLEKRIDPDALDQLIAYDWPGNVRELENIIERLIVTVRENTIRPEDIPSKIKTNDIEKQLFLGNAYALPYKEIMDQFEKQLFLSILKDEKVVSKISARLKIDQSTVRRKLKNMALTSTSTNTISI